MTSNLIYQSVNQSINQSVNQSINQSINQPASVHIPSMEAPPLLIISFISPLLWCQVTRPLMSLWSLWRDVMTNATMPPHWRSGVAYSDYPDGLVQEGRNSSALAMELRLSCINPSIWSRLARNGGSLILMPRHSFHNYVRCDMAFIEPIHHDKSNFT